MSQTNSSIRLWAAAAQPAPHMQPPRLIGNTGEIGELVLPLRIPGRQGQGQLALDVDRPSA